MKMEMFPLAVTPNIELNRVEVTQDWGTGEEHGIHIHPSQVPILIEWLQQAQQEINRAKAAKTAAAGVYDIAKD